MMTTISTKYKRHHYLWQGTNQRGVKDQGKIEAASLRLASMLLQQKGIQVSEIKKEIAPLFGGRKIVHRDIVVLTRQLATLIEGGIPITQALTTVAQSSNKPHLHKLLSAIRQGVESGDNLTSVLSRHPQYFSQLYVGLVNVGEESGTLGPILKRIASYLEKSESIRRKVISALMYPIIVFTLGLLIVTGLLVFIIPKFRDIFSSFGAELPMLTKNVIALSEIIQAHSLLFFGFTIAFYYVYRLLYHRLDSVKLSSDKLILKIPVFGTLIQKSILARISRTIAIMFRAGIPIVETLATITPTTGNQVYMNAIEQIQIDVSTGQALAPSMQKSKVFPSMVLQMVKTGEETGEMDSMLDKAADFYEDEVDQTVASISSLVEPLLIVVLGILIGIIVVAMYLPIFNLGGVI